MTDPVFKVRERPDTFKIRHGQTPQEVSSGKRPNAKTVIQFSVDEYNKPKQQQKSN